MSTENVKELIQSNSDLRSEAKDYVNAYIKFVEDNIPAGLENEFGIGIVKSHPRFGDFWGFKKFDGYACTGSGYYYANDYNCWIKGSTSEEVKCFAKKIPILLKSGFEAILKENEEVANILSTKIDFESLLKV